MLEFTGERVIPGLADPDLFNEHRARYRFAARFARRFGPGAAILDAGCGTGYGTAEFTSAASVTAFDIAGEAVRDARENFASPRVRFLQAGCEALPFAAASFDLVVAFEVIEHLERWPELLREAGRVLKPEGVLLVSTPNKAYYAEARAKAGPNPFHVHEFEYREFASALAEHFAHVTLWTQNHNNSIAFLLAGPSSEAAGTLDAPDEPSPEHAHFFIAACSQSPLTAPEPYAYLPLSGNVLRERERHIGLLESELAQKTTWLQQLEAAHSTLHREHEAVVAELQKHNAWAAALNEQLGRSGARIVQLQNEIGFMQKHSADRLAELEQQAKTRLDWIRDLEAQIAAGTAQIESMDSEIVKLRLAFEERTAWGESLGDQLEEARAQQQRTRRDLEQTTADFISTSAQLAAAIQENARLDGVLAAADGSKWLRLGRAVHLGPDLRGSR